jgi:parallel beta-helix repeat protein
MSRKSIFLTTLVAVLLGMLVFSFRVPKAGAITIRADGSIDGTDLIVSADNITYTLIGNISGFIIVERDNVVVNGAGYTLQGDPRVVPYTSGILALSGRSNVTIKNVDIRGEFHCIYVNSSSRIKICGNNLTSYYHGNGIMLSNTNESSILGNNITENFWGTTLFYSSNNTIVENTFLNNSLGLGLSYSSNNTVYHNNFLTNGEQADLHDSSDNVWDDGYPSGGNYWSNYTGSDLNHDGIGDTGHEIEANNIDRYPLMGEFHSYQTTHVSPSFVLTLVSNSTVSGFDVGVSAEHPENRIIMFNVTGDTGSGFCRLCLPKNLIGPPFNVTIDNGETPVLLYNETIFDNGTHTWMYFAYTHSEHQIKIVPEFPSSATITILMITTTLVAVKYRRRLST